MSKSLLRQVPHRFKNVLPKPTGREFELVLAYQKLRPHTLHQKSIQVNIPDHSLALFDVALSIGISFSRTGIC